ASRLAAGRAGAVAGTAADKAAGLAGRRGLLGLIGAAGLVLITAYALRLAGPAGLVALPTAMFLGVYLACTASGTRILTGAARIAAVPALLAVGAVLAFCGWAVVAAAGVALAAVLADVRRADGSAGEHDSTVRQEVPRRCHSKVKR
ncbi:MAG: hypothetical protein ACRDNZ_12830, partial [Streptosporangiaceae bacterium]